MGRQGETKQEEHGEEPQLFAHLYAISQNTTFTDGHEAIALLTQEAPSAESEPAE